MPSGRVLILSCSSEMRGSWETLRFRGGGDTWGTRGGVRGLAVGMGMALFGVDKFVGWRLEVLGKSPSL